jgi:tyrosyl-tRNA synthetase
VLDEPENIYGKVMRISDEMIPHYIDVAIEATPEDRAAWKARAAAEPMAVKKWVAGSLAALYCGEAAAEAAAEHFRRTVQEKQVDEADITEIAVPEELTTGTVRLVDLIVELKLMGSKSEVRRLVEGGGLKLGGETVTDFFLHYTHEPGVLLQLGKRKVYRLV